MIEVLEQNKSVMDGEVVWAGIVDSDADSATVIAATTGTVANASTERQAGRAQLPAQARPELVDGEWLTSNLEFVG